MRHLATADAKILSILETQQGDLWFGGVQRNIFSYSFEDRSFKRLQASDDIPSRVMKLYQEEGGGIWIGTSLNLCKWDQGMMSSFEPKHVKDILCDRHGVLWFGSRIGLNKLDNGVWTTYTTADGLSDSTVECLAEDHEGTLWLGTDRGLCGLKDGKIFSMGQESGLPLKACRALVYHDHFLYVGMASGLYQIDLDTKHVTAFSEKDGLAGNEVLIRSMAVDHHGHLWIGTTKGLTCYKKDLLKPNMIPPFVKVQRVSTLTADIQETMDIELSHRDNYVRFDFVGLSYSAPEGVRYRYRMNGLSSAWTETEESHVSYAFLPPGTYTFELMACNNDGVWSSSAASFSFSILPPFWKTWWFQSAIGTLFIGFFITAYRVRMVTLYKRNDDLRQMVDERDRMAQALKMSEQNLRITLNSIADAVIATDTQGRITRINPAAERFCGKAESETAGCCLMDVFQLHDEKSGLVSENPVNWILSSGDAIGMAHLNTLVTPDGVTRKVAVSGAPIRTENEQVIGAVLVFRDVTKEYEMREQLTQSCKMDAIGQLAGGVAHDFNNMLGGIMGGAEMLKDYLPANREASALLSIILDSAGRAAELASQLLVFGRKKAHAMVATDVHALIHATAEILRNTLDRRIQLSEDLTQQTPVVLCDAAQVQNVFLNLGINASHAMAHGGKLSFTSRIVELSYQYCSQSAFNLVPGRYVEIMVTDTGDGIRPEHMNRIFEPFFSTKGQGKGTGLGLAIAYGTIQQHGGEILVQSQVGFGTTFIVRLPLVEHGPVEQVTQNFLVPGSGCILVVDDEQVMRSTAEGFLKRCGYDVLLAENGKEAVDIFRAQAGRVSLVVCDMVMPVMNGLDCFKNLQEIDPNVQYVLVTGFAKPEDIAKMNEMGMAGVIKKPYRGSELSRVVANVLKQDRPVR